MDKEFSRWTDSGMVFAASVGTPLDARNPDPTDPDSALSSKGQEEIKWTVAG